MKESVNPVNPSPGIAPLRNVAAFAKVVENLINRAPNMPGLGVGYGVPGLGKSIAASYCMNRFNAVYVECRSYFTKKSLLMSICREMRLQPGKTIFDMVNQIGAQLSLSLRPLLLDEMDHLVDRNLIELVRDIYEVSYAPIFMIGEEEFPAKLRRWGRFYDRVLYWCPAEFSDLADAEKLAKLYAPDVEFEEDLLKKIVQQSRGVARRICVNIERVRQHTRASGAKTASLKIWGDRPFHTGETPVRRAS
jgi:DNA transposition AAA+ family ATPase